MYLFVRRARLRLGATRASLHWATDILDRVNSVTDLGLELYAQAWSPEVGDMAWSAWVEDLHVLEAANGKLMADDTYVDLLDQGADYCMGPPSDGLSRIVHGEPQQGGTYVSVTGSACTNGHVTEGYMNGVRLAQAAEEITGLPTMVLAGATGPYGLITWLSASPDIARLDQSLQKIQSDESFLRLVDEVTPTYTSDPFASQQMIYRKLG